MNNFYDRLNGRSQKIKEKVAQLDKIKPVDDQHKAQVAKARLQLVNSWNEVNADKKAGDDYRAAYDESERINREADQTKWQESLQSSRHEALKKSLGQKYPGSYDPVHNTVNPAAWSQADREAYARSRAARDKAITDNQKKQLEAKNALAKKQATGQRYAAAKKKVDAGFPANNDLTDPCIPCLEARQKKLDRIKAAFPGQQSFGNCGIQSSAQLIQLTNCKKTDETELLKESLRKNDAALVLPKPNEKKKLTPEEKAKTIDAIQSVRDSKKPVETFESKGTYYFRRQGEEGKKADNDNKKIIDTAKTGGTTAQQRENIMVRYSTPTEQKPPDRKALQKAIETNHPVIVSVDAQKLAPAYDENGKEVETWVALEDKVAEKDFTKPDGTQVKKGEVYIKKGEPMGSGGHAVVIADGKFDEAGNLTHVMISDTGTGKIYYMEIKKFEEAHRKDDGGEFIPMNVSVNPINMNCK